MSDLLKFCALRLYSAQYYFHVMLFLFKYLSRDNNASPLITATAWGSCGRRSYLRHWSYSWRIGFHMALLDVCLITLLLIITVSIDTWSQIVGRPFTIRVHFSHYYHTSGEKGLTKTG